MRFRVGAATDVGKVRTRNEDSYLVDAPLYVVADGMGGHRGGDVASRLTVETLEAARPEWGPPGGALMDAVRSANRIVYARSAADRELRGMGTTVTALQTAGDAGRIVHVGDSRAYLLRDGALQQLTQDHTLVQQMVDQGQLAAEDAERHQARHIMTRALGVDAEVDIDELTLDLHAGDRLLLCSDGLSGMLAAEDIRDLLERDADAQHTADALVALAVERGGDDNVTVIVVDAEEGEDAPDEEASATGAGDATGGGDAERSPAAAGGTTTQVIARAEARTTAAAPPQAAAAATGRKPFPWVRLAVWVGALVVVLVVAWVGVRVYVNSQWYVSAQDGKVTVFQGVPSNPLGLTLSHPVDVTDIPSSVAVRLQPWRELEDGITVNSRGDAEAVVDQIRADVERRTSISGPAT
jgi:PPM family protein phosphatase